jgi:FKBP-type peptidyl-prolyl cis-trans isomerase FkpA
MTKKQMNMRWTLFLVVAAFAVAMFSCEDDNDYRKLREKELELLDNYIQKNNITVKPTKTGLYFIDKVKGTGDSVKVNDKVYVYYRTWFIDSTLLDQNIDSLGRYYDPLSFTVVPTGVSASVIKGLNEGVQYMQKGGIATLIIPSELAYEQNTSSGVPMFSTLIMEVRLDRVYKAGTAN